MDVGGVEKAKHLLPLQVNKRIPGVDMAELTWTRPSVLLFRLETGALS
jgi:hypothetical protein